MNPARYHLDSNVLLRFFTGEPAEMFAGAAALIEKAERGQIILELSPLVLAEVAFTLESLYRRSRKEISVTLTEFVTRSTVRLAERDRMLDALRRVREANVHLVDAYLAALSAETKSPVASFDRDLDRFPDASRYEPKP